ncbi:MAG: hypothetical protein HY907_21580 [Deltaproteobacteria bacterium]|nr:hypothetical protein [Deltaproteobacteria bacterium]
MLASACAVALACAIACARASGEPEDREPRRPAAPAVAPAKSDRPPTAAGSAAAASRAPPNAGPPTSATDPATADSSILTTAGHRPPTAHRPPSTAHRPPSTAARQPPAPPKSGAGASACLGDPPSDPPPWVIGYWVSRRRNPYTPEKIQWRALTHLAVGPVEPRADGSIDVSSLVDEPAAPESAPHPDATRTPRSPRVPDGADDLVARAHAAGVKALLFVGGGATHDAFAAAATDETRAAFVAALVRWARDEHGFDGLDLDWEPMRRADHDDFRSLARDLREAWPDVVLTVPVVHHNVNLDAVDPYWAKVAALFDRINVMSYGMAGEYPGWLSWHASALHGAAHDSPTSIADSVEAYIAAGVPAAKLGIGIGFYGVCYTPPVAGPREELRGGWIAAADVDMSYRNIITRYFEAEAWRWDDEAKSPYLSFAEPKGPMGCGYISYEDPRSIAERAAYVKAQGLGGAIVWSIEQGYLPRAAEGERDPLMDALAACFLGR